MKGFLSSFTEFGKQIAQIKSESSGQIFKSMSDQMDTLKTNMRAAGFEMDNLRVKMNAAKASGNRDEEMALKSRMNQLGSETLANNAMKNQLGDYMFWNQPRIGGVTYGDMRMGAMAIPAGIALGAATASTIGQRGQSFLEKGAREENSFFARELGIGQAAAGGNIGRQALLRSGIGREADYMATNGDRFFDNLSLVGRMMGSGFTRSFNELRLEEAQRKSALDAKTTYGLDQAGQFMMGLNQNPQNRMAEMMYGQEGVRQLMSNGAAGIPGNTNSRLTKEESLNALSLATRYGFGGQFQTAMANRQNTNSQLEVAQQYLAGAQQTAGIDVFPGSRNRGTANEKLTLAAERQRDIKDAQDTVARTRNLEYYSDITNMSKDPEALMMSPEAQAQMFRQAKYRMAGGMKTDVAMATSLRSMGAYRSSLGGDVGTTPETAMMAQNYASGLQSQIFTGAVSESQVTSGMLSAMQGARETSADFTGRSASEQLQIGMSTQNRFTGGFKAFGYQEQLFQGAFSRLGIPFGTLRMQIIDLMQKGDSKTAIDLAYGIAKKNNPKITREQVASEFGEAKTGLDKMYDKTFKADAKYDDVLAGLNLPSGAQFARTSGQGADYTMAGEAAQKGMDITQDFSQGNQGGVVNMGKPAEQTFADETKRAQAGNDKAILDAIKRLESKIGEGAIKKEILEGLKTIANAMVDSVDSLNRAPGAVTGE
jgi:hypothetical protein